MSHDVPRRFRWFCTCSTCRAECLEYLQPILASALFGWLP